VTLDDLNLCEVQTALPRTIAKGEEITQDTSTLENPGIVDQLRGVSSPADPLPSPGLDEALLFPHLPEAPGDISHPLYRLELLPQAQ
jgi:hypothetical protein